MREWIRVAGGPVPRSQALHTLATVVSRGALIYGMVTTWRLCRSLAISAPVAVLVTVLAPFSFIIETIVLLRVYAKRTGLKLTFMMHDKEPITSAPQ